MVLNNFLYNGKTKASTLIAGSGVCGLLCERLKHMRLEFLAHTDAVVLTDKLEHHAAGLPRKHYARQADIAAGLAVFDGVACQIEQNLT